MIVRKGVGTSYSVILAPAGIDRIFLHCSGANDTFTLDDIDLEKVKGANLFHFGYPSLMRKMYIDGGKELVRLLKAVHEQELQSLLIWQCLKKVQKQVPRIGTKF